MLQTSDLVVALLAVAAVGGTLASAGESAHAQIDRALGTARTAQLAAEVPAAIRRGQVVTLILRVHEGGHPIESAAACMAAVPLFASIEDALDSTPAGGADLGSSVAPQPACTMGIAGLPSGRGTYEFTWEPDTPGRVNLTFTSAGSRLVVPVDVASAPPNPVILVSFVASVVLVLAVAAWWRRRRPPESGAP
jgi:hypothetical protein